MTALAKKLTTSNSLTAIETVLVRGVNWVGDSIVTIPALREIRRIFPNARISLLVKPWVKGIFEDLECINEIIVYDRDKDGVWQTMQSLRTRKFNVAILFQNAFEAAVIAFGARARWRFGFNTEHRGFLLTHSLKLTPEILALHQIYYYLHIVAQLETKLTGKSNVNFDQLNYYLPVSSSRQDQLRSRLAEFEIDSSKKIIAINPGATNSQAKRWPIDRFAKLADAIIEQGWQAVFIGAGNELEITQAAIKLMRHKAQVLTGKTSLAESIAFLSICDLLISNDTGPAYISAALERPTLTIFGPTNDQMIHPFGKGAEMIRNKVDCAPCMLRVCPIDHRCMTGISVDMVLARAEKILSHRS